MIEWQACKAEPAGKIEECGIDIGYFEVDAMFDRERMELLELQYVNCRIWANRWWYVHRGSVLFWVYTMSQKTSTFYVLNNSVKS